MANELIFMQTPNMKKLLTEFDELSNKGMQEAIKGALIESHKYITSLLRQSIERHRRTGRTENSLENTPEVTIEGNKLSIGVGFHISQGGLPSIFLMYGTPKQAPDTQLYNAVFGAETKKEIAKIQRNYVKQAMKKYLNGG